VKLATDMSIAKVTEITAQSPDGFDQAIRHGIERINDSLRNVQSVWIKDQEIVLHDGSVRAYRVTMKITFVLED
jgi:flavin-binding protein dodecin